MPGRRTFLIGCGSIVAAPALAHLALPLTDAAPSPQPRAANSPASAALAGAVRPEDVALRIDGWHPIDPSGSGAENEVWIRIDSSWRAAWR